MFVHLFCQGKKPVFLGTDSLNICILEIRDIRSIINITELLLNAIVDVSAFARLIF